MKIAIVGSREYPRMEFVLSLVDNLSLDDIVVSGGARGVDQQAALVADNREIATLVFPAQWKRYGKSAGFKRNGLIAEECDRLVAFRDGKSRGTMDTVRKARALGKPVTVYGPDGQEVEA